MSHLIGVDENEKSNITATKAIQVLLVQGRRTALFKETSRQAGIQCGTACSEIWGFNGWGRVGGRGPGLAQENKIETGEGGGGEGATGSVTGP